MKRFLPVISVTIFIALIAGSPIFAASSDLEKGREIYKNKCQICHGADGKGDGPAAGSLSPKPRDFAASNFWQIPDVDQKIRKTVKKGLGPMPAFDLSEEDMNALVDYLTQTYKK